jgi:hypothetical protein
MRKVNWIILATIALPLTASAAGAAPPAVTAQAQVVPSAAPLLRFYPSRLASTPTGVVEDREVWLAKVQGLMAGAPPMLQQSLLQSQTPWEFSANVALLQQMQEGTLKQNAGRIQRQLQTDGASPKVPDSSPNGGKTPRQ